MEIDNLSEALQRRQLRTVRADYLTSDVLQGDLTADTYVVDESDGHYLCATVANGFVLSWHIVDETGTEQESFLYREGGDKWNFGASGSDRENATQDEVHLPDFDPKNPPTLYAGIKKITKEEAQSGDLYVCPAAKNVPCFKVPTGTKGKTDGGTTGGSTTGGSTTGGSNSGGGTNDGGTP